MASVLSPRIRRADPELLPRQEGSWAGQNAPSPLETMQTQLDELLSQNELEGLTTPNLGQALLALRPQLEEQIRQGLRRSPLRVVRLAFRAGMLYCIALILNVPGPQRRWIQRLWPKCVDHMAATIEDYQ